MTFMEWCKSYEFIPKRKKKLTKAEIKVLEKQKLKEMDEDLERFKKEIEERKEYEKGVWAQIKEWDKKIEQENDPIEKARLIEQKGRAVLKLVP